MSDQSKIRSQLDAVKEAYTTDYGVVEESLTEGMSGLKARIRDFKIDLQEKAAAPKKKAGPKYSMKDIADRAIDTYKTRLNPVNPEYEEDEGQPSTHATRTSMKAMANSLAGLRSSGNAGKMTQTTQQGNGDLGQYTSPANNNDGDLGNNTAYGQYYSLTTNMTLEQYQEHINKKFIKEEEAPPATPLVCGVCAEDPCVCEEEVNPIEELKERLLMLDDSAWQSIDMVMREFSHELEVEPKELHKAFKAETGMIPDAWLKENREVQLYGYMPLDEAIAINKIGQVYEVSCLWRGNTMRFKFFYPEMGLVGKEEAQDVCDKFYPGSRLLAHYPVKDDPENYMVIVPQVKEAAEFVPLETWSELPEAADEFYNFICEEVGEPLTPMVYHEEGEYHLAIENHDTGEQELITVDEEGLHAWFNKSSSGGKGGWVQAGGKHDGKPCARQPGQKSTPKCVSSSKRASMSKKERASAHRRKNAADPNQGSKSGAAKPTYVSTDKLSKKNEAVEVDEACWKGYTQKGMKTMFGKRYPNCVKKTKKEEVEYINEKGDMSGLTQKGGHKRSTESGAGLTQKGVEKYRRQNPGSKLKTAVTTPPSKLKPGSKAAGRRKSFCARSRGWTGERGKAARRRWNC